jgi:hypothetical protein
MVVRDSVSTFIEAFINLPHFLPSQLIVKPSVIKISKIAESIFFTILLRRCDYKSKAAFAKNAHSKIIDSWKYSSIFLNHDLNLYNFVIRLNSQLKEKNISINRPEKINLNMITEDQFDHIDFPNKWTNVLDLRSAIELFTPFLSIVFDIQ